MRIRYYSKGKFYLIQCPAGTRVVRSSAESVSDAADSHDHLVVPSRGQDIAIPSDPPELLPLLAESVGSDSRWLGNRCPTRIWRAPFARTAKRTT